jgi:glycosyltransferase involved in cell wall biosynthesis
MSGKEKIRVLHVLGALNPGGVETWLMNVLRHIDRGRFQLDFCLFGREKGMYAGEAEELGSRVIHCPIQPHPWSLGRRFRRVLREGKYNVVHSHVHHFSGAVLRWAHAERVPMRIAHSHNSYDGQPNTPARKLYRGLMKRWVEKYATHGLAASGAAGDALFGAGWRDDSSRRVLYCGIDLAPFKVPVDRAEVRAEFGIPANAPVVGHVGRFDPQKNHKFLLEIAREVIRQRPDVHFLLVGDGPLRPEIEARVRELGLAANVHFAGVRRDVPRLMLGAMDIFLFPSLWEGLPVTIVEAQAAGLRVILADAITKEVAIIAGATRFVATSQPAPTWAQFVLEALAAESCCDAPPEILRSGLFDTVTSTTYLAESYAKLG